MSSDEEDFVKFNKPRKMVFIDSEDDDSDESLSGNSSSESDKITDSTTYTKNMAKTSSISVPKQTQNDETLDSTHDNEYLSISSIKNSDDDGGTDNSFVENSFAESDGMVDSSMSKPKKAITNEYSKDISQISTVKILEQTPIIEILDDSSEESDDLSIQNTKNSECENKDQSFNENSFNVPDDEAIQSTMHKSADSSILSNSNISANTIDASFETNVQSTLDKFVTKTELPKKHGIEKDQEKENVSPSVINCKRSEYNQQILLVRDSESHMMKTKSYMSKIKLSNLPDKGQILKDRFENFKQKYLDHQNKLKRMVVVEEDISEQAKTGRQVATDNWNNIEAGIEAVQPKTFGRKGLENYRVEKALTVELLEQMHGSLKNCPSNDQLAEQPAGIKVQLMEHQKSALAWLKYRETQKPSGGILADDMGLGKTLTMISLILASLSNKEDTDEDEESDRRNKYKGGTLVICPASLLHQWAAEIDNKLKRGYLSYNIYHGAKRETKPKRLAEHDVVITTYAIIMHEREGKGCVFRVRWKRIILDEAHQIRNHKSITSIACCELSSKSRWALTGTPIHNKELDMYSLMKFLRCSPFDELVVWKRWVGEKSMGGGERLHTVISSLMLRRTKSELMETGKILTLPARKWDLIVVNLEETELGLYQKILLFSQTLFAQFLHQRAEKNQDWVDLHKPNAGPNGEYFKMRKKLLRLNKMKEINQHEILVLLLRLRQICCHPSLITNMLQGDDDLGEGENQEESEELNLLDQLNKLNLEDDEDHETSVNHHLPGNAVGIREATRGILNPSHPVFERDRQSSKIRSVMEHATKILSSGDKLIIVSQWSKFLELIGLHLKKSGFKFVTLDGTVPTAKRNDIISVFNDPDSKARILLLSLTAGGVGLNLVGGNHLFLVDLHWNPQLENQAQDRIYRVGQKKNVFIYKFMTSSTIEERIKALQEKKLEMANGILTNSKQITGKLSLQDLKMLFQL